MAKRKIIYESEDDDIDNIPDKGKKSRASPDNVPPGMRRSERAGKGNGGRLAQMKQFEQQQTEKSKQLSKLDIATQGEENNPMAPSSLGVGEARSRRGQEVPSQTLEQPTRPSLRPELMLAAPGQQFGFRIPDAASQPKNNTQAPARTRFPGVYSQPSSKGSAPPSSRSASLFSNAGKTSTVATTRPPSVCSSSGDRRLARQYDIGPTDDTASQEQVFSSRAAPVSRLSRSSNSLQHTSQLEDFHEDLHSDRPSAARIQNANPFYEQRQVRTDRSDHSHFASPDINVGPGFEIDEASPSEDERIAEEHLRRAEDQRESPPPDQSFHRELSPDNSVDGVSGVRDQHSQSPARSLNDQVPPQARSQSGDDTRRRTSRVRDNDVDSSRSNRTGGRVSRLPGNPAPSQSTLPTQLPENVVNIHRRRNHAPRLPSNSQLLAARQRQQALSTTGEVQNAYDGQDRPSIDRQVGPATERSEPWQLQYYDPPTRDVIERAKQLSHCDAASIDPFPVRAAFNSKAVEYIDEAIAERRSRGLIISDGWWPQNAASISRLLWEDLSSWRSGLRKKARTFVTQRYQWDSDNRRDRNIEIAKNLLGNGGQFLKDGVDAEGHANNLAHPALAGLVIDFFYSGPSSVGKLFPEVFATEVPRVSVAIAATALKVVLDEVASGQGEVNFRVNTYTPVYTEILGLMSKCDTSDVHRVKTHALRTRWAELGSNGMSNQEPAVMGCGFDVDLD